MLSAQSSTKKDTEDNNKQYFDTVIVFGQGPVKPIIFSSELTSSQRNEWQQYKEDPFHYKEPDFYLMDNSQSEKEFLVIDLLQVSLDEKVQLKEQKRQKWQKNGWYGLRALGRQNALAAGYLLYRGITKEVILSGGRTISAATKKHLSSMQLKSWPSESELMADIIKQYYGSLYEKKFGRDIQNAITLESEATNTLENFAYCVNLKPELLDEGAQVGFLSAGHHLKRLIHLASIFSLHCCKNGQLSAQEVLQKAQPDQSSPETLEFIADENNCEDVKELYSREERWLEGLKNPEYLSYWLGYVAEVTIPEVLQQALSKLSQPQWRSHAIEVLGKVGLDPEEVLGTDILKLQSANNGKYLFFLDQMRKLKDPSFRVLPPLQ